MKKIIKNKYFWLTAILTAVLLSGYFYHSYLKKQKEIVSVLQSSANITVSQIAPKWASMVPVWVKNYMSSTFPLRVSFNSERDYFNLIVEDETKKQILKLENFCLLVADFNNLEEMDIIILPTETDIAGAVNIDPVFNNSPKKLNLSCDRLTIKEVCFPVNLEELNIQCTDMTDKVWETIGNAHKLRSLKINTSDFISSKNLKCLSSLKKLEDLTLFDLKCDEKDLSFLSELISLKNLNFHYETHTGFTSGGYLSQSIVNKALPYLKNCKNLEQVNPDILLTKANLNNLCSWSNIPNAVYLPVRIIDDEYLVLLDRFLNKLSGSQAPVKAAILKKLTVSDRCKITDASSSFFKNHSVLNLDLRNTGITDIRNFQLESCQTISLPAGIDLDTVISQLKAPEYEKIDLRGVKVNDKQLNELLSQTRPRLLLLPNKGLTEKSVKAVIDAFKKQPGAIMKVSFGDWELPDSLKIEFLERVSQWGTSVIYSSHLDKDLIMPEWLRNKSKTIFHDKKDALLQVKNLLPDLQTIILKGDKAGTEEWRSLSQLEKLNSLYIESKQSGEAINSSGIINSLLYFDIKHNMTEPVKLSDNLLRSEIILKNNDLSNIISLSSGCPQKLVIKGEGTLNLNLLKGASNLKELGIGDKIKVEGVFPELPNLKSLKCGFSLPTPTLKSIGRLFALEILGVNPENIKKDTLENWHSLKKLKSLELSWATLSDADLLPLKHLSSLKTLILPRYESVTPEILKTLDQLPNLNKLDIIGTSIYYEDLKGKYFAPGGWDFELQSEY